MDKNSFLIGLSESDHTDHGRVDFVAQPEQQQVFSAIWALESQVNNGGFETFFEYEEPSLVAFAPEALQAIGAVNCADIVRRANSASPEELDGLDSEFYAYPDNLTDLLYEYVSANPSTFGLTAGGA